MPATAYQRKQIKALSAEGLGIQAIGKRLHIPRGEVKLAIESFRENRERFASPDLPGVPQITDDEADLAADQGRMTDMDEQFLNARIWGVAASIREFNGQRMRGGIHA